MARLSGFNMLGLDPCLCLRLGRRLSILSLTGSLGSGVRRGREGLTALLVGTGAFDPDLGEFVVDLVAAALPLVDLGKAVAELLKLALDVHLLALGADTLKFPLVAALSRAQR